MSATTFAKSSILDILKGFEYVSVLLYQKNHLKGHGWTYYSEIETNAKL